MDASDDVAAALRRRLLDTRLVEPARTPEGHATRMSDHFLGELLARLSVEVTFVDTYSVEKRCEFVHFMDRGFVVIDHALSEHFGVLNYLFGTSEPDGGFTAGLLQRALAEACRMAGFSRRREYAFFIRRALETKPFLRLVRGGGAHDLDIYWQDMLIMGHEVAHAFDPTTPLGESLHQSAMLNVSAALDETIEATNAALAAALGADGQLADEASAHEERFPNVDLGLLAGSLLQGGYDQASVADALQGYATTPRFLDEAACDSFGLALVQSALSSTGERMTANGRLDYFEGVLLAAYRTFLNMRFTSYAADAARVKFEDGDGPINPITLDSLIEFSLRGRLAARNVVGAWIQLMGREQDDEDAQTFMRTISSLNARHTDRLFAPFNALLEKTLYNPEFLGSLDGLLEEDGFSARDFDDDPFRTLRVADGFWRLVAA